MAGGGGTLPHSAGPDSIRGASISGLKAKDLETLSVPGRIKRLRKLRGCRKDLTPGSSLQFLLPEHPKLQRQMMKSWLSTEGNMPFPQEITPMRTQALGRRQNTHPPCPKPWFHLRHNRSWMWWGMPISAFRRCLQGKKFKVILSQVAS